MKVKELIKQLEIYGQEDEILVLYFDKETTEEHHEQEITDQQWGGDREQGREYNYARN